MTEREDKVYQAKLAEQAERYDGRWFCVKNSTEGRSNIDLFFHRLSFKTYILVIFSGNNIEARLKEQYEQNWVLKYVLGVARVTVWRNVWAAFCRAEYAECFCFNYLLVGSGNKY